MKRPHFIITFLTAFICFVVLAMSCLTTLAAAQTAAESVGIALDAGNEVADSTVGGSMISLTKGATEIALNNATIARHGAAWQASKMGASSATIGGLLERRDNLKIASAKLDFGGILIDHVGYTSTGVGEMAGGSYAQGFVTLANGFGKSFVSGLASAAGASIGGFHGAVFGTAVGGPAGTVAGGAWGGIAGGIAGGNLGSEAWDASVGKLITTPIKDWVGENDDRRQFREQSGPLMHGMTSKEIHENWLKYKKELAEKMKLAAKEKEKAKIVPPIKPQLAKVKEKEKIVPPTQPQPVVGKEKEKIVPPAQPQPLSASDSSSVSAIKRTSGSCTTTATWPASPFSAAGSSTMCADFTGSDWYVNGAFKSMDTQCKNDSYLPSTTKTWLYSACPAVNRSTTCIFNKSTPALEFSVRYYNLSASEQADVKDYCTKGGGIVAP